LKQQRVANIGWAPRYAGSVFGYCWRFWRHRAMAWVATAAAVGAVLTVASTTELFLVLGERSLQQQLRSASEFQVFLSDGATQQQIAQLQQKLANQPGVQKVTYRDKQDAFRLARQDPNLAKLANQSGSNPFPASLVVDLSDPGVASNVSAAVEGQPATDQNVPASYTPDQAHRLNAFLSLAQAIVIGIAVAGLAVASLVALVLLRSEIRARRAELRILTLVGTPRSVIRFPLLVEAISLAIAGSVVAALVMTYVGGSIVPAVDTYVPFLQLGNAAATTGLITLATLASSVVALGGCSLFVRLPR
jgi:cell division transport system permease protein